LPWHRKCLHDAMDIKRNERASLRVRIVRKFFPIRIGEVEK